MGREIKNKTQQLSIDQINMQYGKLPPQAIEVEEAVLGALILEQDSYSLVSGIIDTQSFYKDEHRKIYEAIKYLSGYGKNIDLLTVTQELKNRNELNEIGGPIAITKLVRMVASAAHIEFHARIIAQKFIQRELIRVSTEIQTKSYDDTIDVDDLLNEAKLAVMNIDDSLMSIDLGKSTKSVAVEEIKEIEEDCKKNKAGKMPGITTGLSHLNYLTGGWRNNELCILAARPSVGKTSLALFFARKAAESGIWVNFYSFEMKAGDLYRINISAYTSVKRTNIRDGDLSEEDWSEINSANTRIEKLNILWFDNPRLTVANIRTNTVKNKRAGRCGLVIVDYLQLIQPTDKKAIREQQISDISRTLKETAMECSIPVIALSQLNRDVEKRADKEPNLSDLRESGAIEQDADKVMFVWDKENPKLKIEKQRRGRIGHVHFFANEERTYFADKEPDIYEGVEPVKNFDKQPGYTRSETIPF